MRVSYDGAALESPKDGAPPWRFPNLPWSLALGPETLGRARLWGPPRHFHVAGVACAGDKGAGRRQEPLWGEAAVGFPLASKPVPWVAWGSSPAGHGSCWTWPLVPASLEWKSEAPSASLSGADF